MDANDRVLADAFPTTVRVRSSVRLNLVAELSGDVDHVVFELDNRFLRRENGVPYAAFGDNGGELFAWKEPVLNK